ncbi:MAG: YihY/virulence factor BrkB family protein [Bacteroidota bacterium]
MKFRQAKKIWLLVRDSAIAWDSDNVLRLGAALSYYTVLSLSPLLIIIIVLSSFGFGKEAASGHLVAQIRGIAGIEGAKFVQSMIESAYNSGASIPAAIFSVFTLFLGASGVFVELRDSLNTIWRVKRQSTGTILAFLHGRFLSIIMIIGLGFLLLVSLLFSAIVRVFSNYLSTTIVSIEGLFPVLDVAFSLVGIMLLIALIFKYLPDAVVTWSDVWIGAAVTSLLFSVGKVVIGLYLGSTVIGTAFGAASSLVMLMIWAFYSIQIILFGAEFTRLYADRFGTTIVSR